MMQANPVGDRGAGAEIVKSLRTSGNRAPSKSLLVQFYMKHPDYKDEIHRVYKEETKSSSGGKKKQRFDLARLNAIAARLLEEESDETIAELEEELESAHDADIERYEAGFAGEVPTCPEEIREYVFYFGLT
jgi:hypothetical protein